MYKFVLNFFVWWYLIVVKEFFEDYVVGRFIYNLNITNTLPMAKNLTVPLFQDDSGAGKAFSFVIRFVWIGVGSVVSLLTTIPFLLFGLLILVLPFLPFVQFISYLSHKL